MAKCLSLPQNDRQNQSQIHRFQCLKIGLNRVACQGKKGRIQSVGVSNYSAAQMALAHQYLAEKGIFSGERLITFW